MSKQLKGNFISIDPNAKIFEELKRQQPDWWNLFQNDTELYIEIRKDNYFNVYYFGGSVAKIAYKNGFIAETHQKYLGDYRPYKTTEKGKEIFKYQAIELENLDSKKISEIKTRIDSDYLQNNNDEKPAEKWIQGEMVRKNPDFIDSEFQFNSDVEVGKLRIDLVELSNGVLTFVELKGIFDSRLRNDSSRNSKTPEILEQMEKYSLFIHKYEREILEYYKKLLTIKQNLGLIPIQKPLVQLNKVPKLIVANTYKKMTNKREVRIEEIIKLLDKHNIHYEMVKM
jgi:hypothetical protein